MTVSSSTPRNDYVGNGATATYSYSFRIFAATDLLVTTVDTAGVETTLTYPTDYSVTGVGSYSGGTITLTAGNLANGYGLTVRFHTTLTQATDYRNQDSVYLETIEDGFDRAAKIDQQQQDEIDRSVKLPETEAGTMTLPTLANRASRFLAFDAGGDPIGSSGAPASVVPVSAFMETVLDDTTAAAARATLGSGVTGDALFLAATAAAARATLGSAATGDALFLAATAAAARAILNAANLSGDAAQAFNTAALTAAGLITTNGQVAFPASQNASAGANTLDDYEEGSFTPVITPAGGTITNLVQYGYYTKIGRLVTFQIYATVLSVSSPTGDLTITGLPSAGSVLSQMNPAVAVMATGLTGLTTESVVGNVVTNVGSTNIALFKFNSGTTGAMAANVQAGSAFYISGSYCLP